MVDPFKLSLDTKLVKNYILAFVLLVVSVISTYIVCQQLKTGILIFGILLFIPLFWILCINANLGFIIFTILNFFLFTLYRIVPVDIAWGTLVEALGVVLLLGIIINKKTRKEKLIESDIYNPITFIVCIYSIYGILQVANPSATSLNASFFSLKSTILNTVIVYFICYRVFCDFKFVKLFVKLLILVCLINAIYAFHQEYVGLLGFEWRWLTETPERFNLMYIWGNIRKWSLQSDVATFGMLMGFSGIFTLILAAGSFIWWKKIILLISGILMVIAMTFSGTRAAFAMIPVGFLLYLVFHLNNKKILGVCAIVAFFFAIIYFGPFYNQHVIRFRSTFEFKDDASLNMRDINRKKVQPYIWNHPIGGGVFTTGTEGLLYSPGHPLAGFPPDSTFLQQALEKGWIGFGIFIILLTTSLLVGINNYFTVSNLLIKQIYIALICSFFSLTIAAYAQPNMNQKPLGLINIIVFVLMFRLKTIDENISFEKVKCL